MVGDFDVVVGWVEVCVMKFIVLSDVCMVFDWVLCLFV